VVGISETTAVTTLANGFTDLHISGNGVSYDVIFHDDGADEMWSVLKSPSTVRFSSSRSENDVRLTLDVVGGLGRIDAVCILERNDVPVAETA